MSVPLRIILLLLALMCVGWIFRRIYTSRVKMEDAIYWILFSFVLALLGIFPKIAITLSALIGIQSPANLVFLVIIGMLVEKVFTLSIIQSQMQEKNVVMIAEMAILNKDLERQIESLQKELDELKVNDAK